MASWTIPIARATGLGPTPLSAFDAALARAGAADRNLLRLSSVIPPGVSPLVVPRLELRGAWGDRLYCVYAERRAEAGVTGALAAGIGWLLFAPDGRGVFVEHSAAAETVEQARSVVQTLVTRSLDALAATRRWEPLLRGSLVEAAPCAVDQATAVLVLAAYREEGWWE
jgi:arginine decarboxylase